MVIEPDSVEELAFEAGEETRRCPRRIAELPHTRVHELRPWNWKDARQQTLAA